ncbi:MAG: hypothetical protein DCF15_05885 [Phormidesmis priestleyi]|uniref:Uncharacterized protein n=1 Tax=Phormidesmis priestleyi TaxID=268141 RepID=A0A2W4ZIU3_9CYAN|nr:MAG: hypothetical protein DCF15_05885 [Phormidesmis priestleyi]
MPQTKEQQAAAILGTSNTLLDELKGKATAEPTRSRPKSPKKGAAKTTKTAAKKTPTSTDTPVQAELVHAPVSGSGINGVIRGDIGQTDPQTMAQALVAIQQQQNTVLVSQANKKLDKEVAVDQGLGLSVQLQQEKNATVNESISTQAMKTRQQGAKTSLEGVRLQGLNIDLEGEAALLPHRQEGWSIKSEGMAIDNEGARTLLQPRREHWAAKLQLAHVGLQQLSIQIQQAQSELYAPVEINQLND